MILKKLNLKKKIVSIFSIWQPKNKEIQRCEYKSNSAFSIEKLGFCKHIFNFDNLKTKKYSAVDMGRKVHF